MRTIKRPSPDNVESCLRDVPKSEVDVFVRIQGRQPVRCCADVVEGTLRKFKECDRAKNMKELTFH